MYTASHANVQIFIKFAYTFVFSGRTCLLILIITHIKNKQYTIQSVDFKRLVFYLFLPHMHSFFTQKQVNYKYYTKV